MTKTILVTGSTDGIGYEAAKQLAGQGHTVLLHGRSEQKLVDAQASLGKISGVNILESYRADLSNLKEVEALADKIKEKHETLDVLINNAGVFKVPDPVTSAGQDIRFVVNVLAPYDLTKRLLPIIPVSGRVVNLSSAAQAPVNTDALMGKVRLSDDQAYAQSKLAITMWSAHLAETLGSSGPAVIAVNPASFLGSKMVKEAYGVAGNDLKIGADILCRAALSDEFSSASGKYYDNDQKRFTSPHPDALDAAKNSHLVQMIEELLVS